MLTLLTYRFCFRYLLLQSFCFQQVSHYKTFTSYYFKAFVTSGPNMTEYIFFHSISHYQKRKLQGNTFFLITSVYCVSVTQSCLTLCDPMGCSPPGSFVHGILQARILEWVAISFSRGSSWARDWTQVSCIVGRCFNLWPTRESYGFSSSHVQMWKLGP